MGVPLVNVLLRAGHYVTVWNRTPKPLKDLGLDRAHLANSVAAAVDGCDVAFTMLADDKATEEVVYAHRGLLARLPENSIHIALSTIGVALSRRLTASHAEAGQHYIAAPVFGRPNVAAEGKLWIIAAGDTAIVERVRLLLATMGRGLTILGKEPCQANAAKLAGNMLITAMIQSLSESFVFAQAHGVNPELFLKTVNEALFQSPFYLRYGNVMLHPPQHPGSTAEIGAKDTRLLREAAEEAGIRMPLADYFQQQLNTAIENGMGHTDWAVAQYRMAEKTSKGNS